MNIGILEGILFVVGEEGITKEKLAKVLEIDEKDLECLINALSKRYESSEHGIMIAKFGDKYKLVTKKEHKSYYQKLVDNNYDGNLSQASLETLAIIAYNYPITRSEIEEIRGVNCDYQIRKLLAFDLIKEVGKSDLPGRPNLYGITDSFLDYFGLSKIEDLPKLEEIDETLDDVDLFDSKYKEDNL